MVEMMGATEQIIDAWKTKGLSTGFIYGKFADGKTSYLLHICYEVFKHLLNLSKVDAWMTALDHIFFDPILSMAYIEAHRSKHPDGRVVILGMDDVGQHIPRARWWREDVVQFREWMTVARTDVAGVYFTAPTQMSLPGGIIDSCFMRYKVKKDPEHPGMSMAQAYEVSVTPWFQKIVSGPKWTDHFPTHYPPYVFEEYQAMRKDMVAPLRRHLINLRGPDYARRVLRSLGATQKGVGTVLGVTRQAISLRERQEKQE